MPRRYRVRCHACANGFIEGRDDEGNRTLDNCRWCYRGEVTIVLDPEAEDKLLAELQKARGK